MITSYLDMHPKERQEVISTLRQLIFDHLPKIQEHLQYKMPTYTYKGKNVIAIAAQKHYYSVYIMNLEIKEKYVVDFAHLNVGKSCIRFKRLEDFPLTTFKTLLKEIAQT